jgi:hypothetical protein
VSFTPDGTQLLVTEKGTRTLDIFNLLSGGLTDGPFPEVSSGNTRFGFAFGLGGTLIISGAEAAQGTTSSYRITGMNRLQPVSTTVADHGTAACWIVVTGTTTWVVNTITDTISSIRSVWTATSPSLNPKATFTGVGSSPIDAVASSDNA